MVEVNQLNVLSEEKSSFKKKSWGNSPELLEKTSLTEARLEEVDQSKVLSEEKSSFKKKHWGSRPEFLSEGRPTEDSKLELWVNFGKDEKSSKLVSRSNMGEENLRSSTGDIRIGESICMEEDNQVEIISHRSVVEEIVGLFEMVQASGEPNFKKCRIPVKSGLNISVWRRKLREYSDKVVCEYLQFGFPLDFDTRKKLSDKERRNHKGAREYPNFIDKYLERETSAHRIMGPFESNPLSAPLIVSPMNSVPKASSTDERRVIVDLSWPHGASVNDGISKDVYLGELINLHYASVQQVCEMVIEVGRGAHIYKRDLRHAYRQIPVDPRDYKYLGYFWNNSLYFDTALAMGQRNAAMACSRTTKAVMYMHAADGYTGTSYLDDLIGVEYPDLSEVAYLALGDLLLELGLGENFSKA